MKKKVSIIGGGPAGMMLACQLDTTIFDINLFEKNKSLGLKFLVAGKGGFNLTHSESIQKMISRYTPSSLLKESLLQFNNVDLVNWLDEIGIPTYTGTSKRIFPIKDIKPAFVLSQIIKKMKQNRCRIKTSMKWGGWNKNSDLIFNNDQIIQSDISIFTLGGASWKKTGSNGKWLDIFKEKNIKVQNFESSNSAIHVKWPDDIFAKIEGKALKNIALSSNNYRYKGEITFTKKGIEGSPAYALNGDVRIQLAKKKQVLLYLDLKPNLSLNTIISKINLPRKKSWTAHLKQTLNLQDEAIALLRYQSSKEEYTNPIILSTMIKKLPIFVQCLAKIDEAISTVGGIHLEAIDNNFELKKLKNQFVLGEMLDWDAPTGGYLLQACFSMGSYLANILNQQHG